VFIFLNFVSGIDVGFNGYNQCLKSGSNIGSSRVHNSASHKYNFVKRIWLQAYSPILIILLHRKTRRYALYDSNIV